MKPRLFAANAAIAILLAVLAIGVAKASDAKPDRVKNDVVAAMFKRLNVDIFGSDISVNINGTCDSDIHLVWNSQVGSSIVATPVITDLNSDGRKEILIGTATHFLEALDGITGEDLRGFPFAHPQFATQASPLEVDKNHDGTGEWMISTFDGNLIFVDNTGAGRGGWTVRIPPIPVKRNWLDWAHFVGVDALDQSEVTKHEAAVLERRKRFAREDPKHFDIAGTKEAQRQQAKGGKHHDLPDQPLPLRHDPAVRFGHHEEMHQQPVATPPTQPPTQPPVAAQPQLVPTTAPQQQQQQPLHENVADQRLGRKVQQLEGEAQGADPDFGEPLPPGYAPGMGHDDYYGLEDGMLDTEGMFDEDDWDNQRTGDHVEIGADGWLSSEAKASMDLIYHPELYEAASNVVTDEDIFVPRRGFEMPQVPDDEHILLDAHILATPVVLDLDLDGGLDAVVPVSYFFDLEFYAKRENSDRLPQGIDMMHYAAAGIVAVDLETGKVKWARQLDLTHRRMKHAAFAMSSPIVANGDLDGVVDVYMTTASGSIVGFDAKGNVKSGFPISIGPTHAGCVIEDINADGKLDICAGDLNGVVSCFDLRSGAPVWEYATNHGSIAETPTIGDVNGDGYLDVVFGTTGGGIWALDGRSGKPLPHFPVIANGAIVAPILLVNLNNTNPPAAPSVGLGLHAVVVALDGVMYVASGRTGCVQITDIGEESYTMVLTDDVTGNGKTDLVVTTLSGSVFVFETAAPFHPLKQWTSRIKGLNTLTASEGHLGVFIEPESRVSRDVRGDYFHLMITIKDNRVGRHQVFHPRYYVTVTIGKRLMVLSRLYFEAKTYTETIPTPLERVYGPVIVTMRTPELLGFEDRVAMSFNMHFLETIKYVFLIPFFATLLALAFVRKKHEVQPMQLHRGRHRGEEFYYYS